MDTKNRVIQLIGIHSGQQGLLPRLTDRLSEYGFDSLDAIELVMHIEEEFKIHIDDDYIAADITVEQVIAAVEKALGEAK
jgi:acyl carrier protein